MLGKYDTYKGSTPTFPFSKSKSFSTKGNMILIKDRHPFCIHHPPFHILGNMILIKDRHLNILNFTTLKIFLGNMILVKRDLN